jgi:hypothetical protein
MDGAIVTSLVDVRYTAADLRESRQAILEARRGPGDAGGRGRRVAFGWALWLGLSVVFFILLQVYDRPMPLLRSTGWSAHNFPSAVLLPIVPLLLHGGMVLLAISRQKAVAKVPFHTPQASPQDLSWYACRTAGMLFLASGVITGMVVWEHHDDLNWDPHPLWLLLLAYVVSVVIITVFGIVAARRQAAVETVMLLRPGSGLAEPRRVDLLQDGIACRTAVEIGIYHWPAFVSYFETENLLILYTRDLQPLIIPKRFFMDEQQMRTVYAAVHTNIANGRLCQTISGFAVVAPSPVLPPPLPTAPRIDASHRPEERTDA